MYFFLKVGHNNPVLRCDLEWQVHALVEFQKTEMKSKVLSWALNLNMMYFFLSEWVNSGLTSHQQEGYMETEPWFKVSYQRLKKWGIDLAIPGLVVYPVIHYTTAAPTFSWKYIQVTQFWGEWSG